MIRAEQFMSRPAITHSRKLINKPAVSIVLPTFCRGDNGLLKRAIDSVLSQTFSNFELIVMDDGSTDGTATLLSDYVQADDRIIHVRHDSNCGLPALRVNEGLLMARADLCAYQFDDDQWTDGFLAAMVSQLQANPSFEVAYGLCQFVLGGAQQVLGGPFNYSQLVAGNFIANNSVMHRRSVFERLGGYDMHLLMRRLCDWDLWLRWGHHVSFLFVDEVVSLVEGGLTDSIGATATFDVFASRAHMASDRTASLRPDALKSFVLDDLEHLRHLGDHAVEAIWRQQVAPFQSRFREIWAAVRPPKPRPTHVLVAKAHFDTTVDITINNFAEALAGDFVLTFVPQAQIDEAAIRCADILVLHRTIDQHAEQLAAIARKHGKSVVFLMDDDLTSLHEVSDEFSYLAPGTACRLSLDSLIHGADLVITYSRLMQESIEELNPCNVRLETNIKRKWLANAKSRASDSARLTAGGEQAIKIGFAGSVARREEFAVLWPAIVSASRDLGRRAEFHFWGLSPGGLDELQSPYKCEPFTFSYDQYLNRLTTGGFDLMIAPLFAEKRAKRAKCPIKFLESTAAGAIGIYSDVEPYDVVEDGVSGIKCLNTVEHWTAAILRAASLTPSERVRMLAKAIDVVEQDYTSEAQAPRVAATLEAAVLHSQLRRTAPDKPRIAYFCHSPYLGGAENHLLRHAMLAQVFRFEPILVLPSSASSTLEEVQRRAIDLGFAIAYLPLTVETEMGEKRVLDNSAINEIQDWLRKNRIALVHSVTVMREVGEATRSLGIPHVVSLYATNSEQAAGVDHCDVVHSDSFFYANRWSQVLNVSARRILSYVPDAYFNVGDSAEPEFGNFGTQRPLTIGLFGTLQPRKGQLQAIEAVGLLRKRMGICVQLRLYGYHSLLPDYIAACKEMACRYAVSDLVSFAGFVRNPAAVLQNIDAVLCASDWESLPQAILEAMAANRLVIAPRVGGVGEVVSNRTGILMRDNRAESISRAIAEALRLTKGEWRAKTALANEVARQECSRFSVASELFQLYRQAIAARVGLDHSQWSSPASGVPQIMLDGTLVSMEKSYESIEHLRRQLHEINAEL